MVRRRRYFMDQKGRGRQTLCYQPRKRFLRRCSRNQYEVEPQRSYFYSEEYNKLFAKRIIGLPGDHIQFRDGYVVINDQYCKEDYLDKEIETNCTKEFTVPDNCYFMLGDNREKSNDSRYWKNPYIVRNDILGKYMGQYDFSIQYDILNKKTQSDI